MIGKSIRGRVVRVEDGTAYVYLQKEKLGGCAGCSSAGSCSADSCNEEVPAHKDIREGDVVLLRGTASQRGGRGLLFYAGAFALFIFGFSVGDTLSSRLAPAHGGVLSLLSGFLALLIIYGPVLVHGILERRRGPRVVTHVEPEAG